ncbi:Type 2 DNA topoisomerase 6 subunit B-like [Anabarilius grahami]|uniref:Type 2 DNA topoisomerase 6 subunit B-like n=1 Tax=Anabarilius grahami TaxID=495550 RepID=A0A3N0YMH7_ANAGA|nr:Type 2 DNA topoisomerase 6 subunit B-like [Anabarilius grahami]
MVVTRAFCESPAILTVSAAGAWCSKVSESALKKAMERLSSQVPPRGLCSDVEFSVETDYSQETRCSDAVEQTLTVFIFTQYSDPFRSQIPDFISSEELFERHLDAVFWYNGDQVRATLQSTMIKTLKGFHQRHAARQRLNSAISIVLSSVNSIIASSSSGEFRRACFDSMRVEEAVSTEQSSLDSWEKAFENPPELSSKRIHCDLESFSFIPEKKQCSEPFSENSDTFVKSAFEAANIQRSPLSPIQLPQSQQTGMIADIPSALSLAKPNNEQVEKQWLQELENLSEWD